VGWSRPVQSSTADVGENQIEHDEIRLVLFAQSDGLATRRRVHGAE